MDSLHTTKRFFTTLNTPLYSSLEAVEMLDLLLLLLIAVVVGAEEAVLAVADLDLLLKKSSKEEPFNLLWFLSQFEKK